MFECVSAVRARAQTHGLDEILDGVRGVLKARHAQQLLLLVDRELYRESREHVPEREFVHRRARRQCEHETQNRVDTAGCDEPGGEHVRRARAARARARGLRLKPQRHARAARPRLHGRAEPLRHRKGAARVILPCRAVRRQLGLVPRLHHRRPPQVVLCRKHGRVAGERDGRSARRALLRAKVHRRRERRPRAAVVALIRVNYVAVVEVVLAGESAREGGMGRSSARAASSPEQRAATESRTSSSRWQTSNAATRQTSGSRARTLPHCGSAAQSARTGARPRSRAPCDGRRKGRSNTSRCRRTGWCPTSRARWGARWEERGRANTLIFSSSLKRIF